MCVIAVHMLRIAVSNNWLEVMVWTCFCSSCLILFHICSVILRSGLWEMTCNKGPNKVINDFNIFLAINITVNNCQSAHTVIGDAVPDHQTYTNITMWIQAWWGQISTWFSIPNSTLYSSLPSRNHLHCLCLFNLHHASRFFHCNRVYWCFFYNSLVIFCFIQFSFNWWIIHM